jgi:hypothetical protein
MERKNGLMKDFKSYRPTVMKNHTPLNWLLITVNTYSRTHTHYIERYMRSHLIACLEKDHSSPFPQSTSSNTEVVKVYTRKIESSCYCGKPDVFQNMVGYETTRGRVKCSKWVHQSCSGVSGDWFCDEHRRILKATDQRL